MTDKKPLDEGVVEASDLILDMLKDHDVAPTVAALAMTKVLVSMLFMISETYQDATHGVEAVRKSMEADLQILYDHFAEEKLTARTPQELETLIKARASQEGFKI